MEGFISINRKILEWEWYSDNNVKSLFIHCLIKANFKEKSWRGHKIKRGQFITSYSTLSKELGLSVQQVRTSFEKLKATKELTSKATNKNTLVTVVKYNDYQKKQTTATSKPTNEQQTDNKQVTTTNKDNKENNVLEINSEWRNNFFKHYQINLEEYLKKLSAFSLAYDMERPEKELKQHFFNWFKNQDYKKHEIVIPHWNENRDK